MALTHIAYLGPEGTFSHLVARKRFGRRARLVPLPSIFDVFAYARSGHGRLGLVPIENSSGGTIYETIDCLVDEERPVSIREELAINVKLALLGRRGEKIKVLYSHFAPMQHCEPWIRKHLPRAERRAISSTAKAAEAAAAQPGAAALGLREAARRYGLQILRYPVQGNVPNLTQFIVVGRDGKPASESSRMSLVVRLKNRPGSLCDFLTVFKEQNVNLTRLLSRPIIGQPKAYLFFVDVDGTPHDVNVRRALAAARKEAEQIRVAGIYPVRRPYVS